MKLRTRFFLLGVVAIGFAPLAVAHADDDDDDDVHSMPADTSVSETDDDDDDDEPASYGNAGVWEVGGSGGGFWSPSAWTVNIAPSIGYFFIDYFQVTFSVHLNYENTEEDDGQRSHGWFVDVLVEPSYHLPVIEDRVFILFGVGLGAGYDGTTAGGEIAPRIGVNVTTGIGGIVTPAIRVPVLLGVEHDELGNGHFNATANVGVELGYTNQF